MKINNRKYLWATMLATVGLAQAGVQAAYAASAASRELPNWDGWWAPREPWSVEFQRNPPPMKDPQSLAKMQAAGQSAAADPDPGRYCRPPQFVGVITPYAPNVEFLLAARRVTITTEAGLLRRIYTDAGAAKADTLDTSTGTSIGHWEGQTLVVVTTGISETNRFPVYSTPGGVWIGKNARITERIALDGQTLNIDQEIIAPDILSGPYKRKFSFRRVANKYMAQEMPTCKENDRAFDAATGTQRFDMTPPADLPPPPRQ